MRRLRPIVIKELRDHFRDRRSMLTAAIMSLVGPMVMLAMFSQIGKAVAPDQPLKVTVAGAFRAPSVIRFLERQGATIEEAPADYEARIRDGALDFVLEVPEAYARDFESSRPATLRLVRDTSRQKMADAATRTEGLLQRYGAEIAMTRLIARGISPALLRPVPVQSVDLATAENRAVRVVGGLAMFLLIAAFAGGGFAALDTTAGERERGSLEPLLMNPVSRGTLVLGKAVGALVVAGFVVFVTGIGTAWAMHQLPLHDMGVRLQLGGREYLALLAVLLPMAGLGTALQLLIGIFSRSFKEAQTYVSVLTLLPMAPGMYLLLNPAPLAGWLKAVPFLGQTALINEVLRGDPLNAAALMLAALVSLILAAACVAGVVHMLGRERVIFGR
jgi:sodium transport system permease protein